MKRVTLDLSRIQDPAVRSALQEIIRASTQNVLEDVAQSGAALVTLKNAAANQVPYFTALDKVALLTLGAAAGNLVQLDGSGHLPALDGSALTALNASNLASGTVAVARGGVDQAAWTAYTPAVSASAGTFTTVSAAGRYKQIGKTVFFSVAVTITVNGTAATAVVVGLPVTAQNANFTFAGRENAVTGSLLVSWMGSTTTMLIQKYDGTYLGANGYLLVVSGSYEAA